jgi:hypothetical protein
MIQAITSPSQYQATFSRKQAMRLAERCLAAGSLAAAADIIERTARRIGNTRRRGTWGYLAKRFAAALRERRAHFAIFNDDGNTKLPFCAFSSLALFSCPGAGECREYCYSLRAWRYPAPFYRQLQNSLFMRFAPDLIEHAFAAIPQGRNVRLYVDGDFASTSEVAFWFGLIDSRKDLTVYGYSKSWREILEHGDSGAQYPSNYVLNLSSGSVHGDEMRARMLALPITRGEFVAVRTENRHPRSTSARFSSREYHADVRAAARAEYGNPRVFSCTGKCGTCAKSTHACGDAERFAGVLIAIGVH